MTLVELKCTKCGERFKVPVGPEARTVTCPGCGARVSVPREEPPGAGPGMIEVTCPDCRKSFSALAGKGNDIVDCPSCGSWVRTAPRRGGILYRPVPMPFQFTPSVRRWLRFLAGLMLIMGLLGALYIAVTYGTTVIKPEGQTLSHRVINLPGVLGAVALALGTVVATVALMALYWILQNVDAMHYHMARREKEQE